MATFRFEESDETPYKDFHSPILRAHGEFLFKAAKELNWEDLVDSTVMDVGCGMSSLTLFNKIFPEFQKVIAIDGSPILDYVKRGRKNKKMEYHKADITVRSTLKEWEAKMSKITSFNYLSCFKQQKIGFENIHYMLQPGGEAIISTSLKNPHYECAKSLLQEPKWDMYKPLLEKFTNAEAHLSGISYYQEILKGLDFEIIRCEEKVDTSLFGSVPEFRASPLTMDNKIGVDLPEVLKAEFNEEYVQTLMELGGQTDEGFTRYSPSRATMIVRKKKL